MGIDELPPAIEPDTKNWTWVLDGVCPECGLDASILTGREVPGMIRDSVARWQVVLVRPDVRVRPHATVWSPLEYACHARDVFRVFAERLALMLGSDDPLFPSWDQEETAVAKRYWTADPTRVVAELTADGMALAQAFEQVPNGAWSRRGRRSDGARFTVDSIARYFVHDLVHHLYDVRG